MEDSINNPVFLFGIGDSPRIKDKKHLSRSWSQKDRVYDINGISPTICSQETQGRYYILVKSKEIIKYGQE